MLTSCMAVMHNVPMTTTVDNPSREHYRKLQHEADIAAYQVLGAARVLFLMVSDEHMKKSGLEAIASYDAARATANAYEKSDEYQRLIHPELRRPGLRPDGGSYEDYKHIKAGSGLRDNDGRSAEEE